MTQYDFEAMRRAMVSNQLRTAAVNDPHVLAALRLVARERFVPAEAAALAYVDRPVGLGAGRSLNPPMATGRLLTELHPQPGEHALVVGAATGYSAALLAAMGTSVVALEEDAALLDRARASVDAPGVTFVQGTLASGCRKKGPYDLILVDGAVEQLPQPIVDQLRDGGRLAVAIVDRGVSRLAVGRRIGKGFGLSTFADVEAVALPGFAAARTFAF